MTDAPLSRYALRFRRSHARTLRHIGGRVDRKLRATFTAAASAAKAGEPLGLTDQATTAEAANELADAFPRFGAPRPVVLEARPGGWAELG